MQKNFKVISLESNIDPLTGLEFLMAEMAEILPFLDLGLEEPFSHLNKLKQFSPTNTIYFIYLFDSDIAKKIVEDPTKDVVVNFEDFEEKRIGTQNGTSNGYFHREFSEKRNAS